VPASSPSRRTLRPSAIYAADSVPLVGPVVGNRIASSGASVISQALQPVPYEVIIGRATVGDGHELVAAAMLVTRDAQIERWDMARWSGRSPQTMRARRCRFSDAASCAREHLIGEEAVNGG